MKTPIVYYGGKTAILPHMLEMVPQHNVYTEVFFGGGTLFWAKTPVKNETINDISDIVINFYQVLRSNFRKLHRMIDQSLMARSLNRKGNTLVRRAARGERVNAVELAWAFWYTTNFNYYRKLGAGMSFSNHKGRCTPDRLQTKKKEFTDLLVQRIEHAYIENDNYLKILKSRNVHDAFHEIDPPYFYGATGRADHGHYRGAFTIQDYHSLLDWLATECTGKFMLHNYNSDVLTDYIEDRGWYKREITHRLAAPRKSGGAKVEVIVTNYATPCGTLKLFQS